MVMPLINAPATVQAAAACRHAKCHAGMNIARQEQRQIDDTGCHIPVRRNSSRRQRCHGGRMAAGDIVGYAAAQVRWRVTAISAQPMPSPSSAVQPLQQRSREYKSYMRHVRHTSRLLSPPARSCPTYACCPPQYARSSPIRRRHHARCLFAGASPSVQPPCATRKKCCREDNQ
ncbi:hypothetical protein NPIL_110991 [Nephila pilipes]|uniref:Uncharacterized protein n=1 Tax=Nephila pilipes TaxID=299642 RepID=A0A8X6NT56_NEPPI|nr:hypothetical protein NPIL_110991 [Nephila pilipes]